LWRGQCSGAQEEFDERWWQCSGCSIRKVFRHIPWIHVRTMKNGLGVIFYLFKIIFYRSKHYNHISATRAPPGDDARRFNTNAEFRIGFARRALAGA
jgi:hypothetical protein